MYYHGYAIRFVELSPRSPQFDPVFLIHKRGSDEIIGKASSIADAIDIIREFEDQLSPNLRKSA